jgi:transposase
MAEYFRPGDWCKRDYDNLRTLKLHDSLQVNFDILLRQLDHLIMHKKALINKLRELSKKERYNKTFNIIKTSPGIGWFSSIRLVLEWGEDLSRFKTGNALASYVGLATSEYSTGDTIHKGGITKQGNRFIRSLIIQCAWAAIRKDPALLKKFQDVWKHSGSKKKRLWQWQESLL